MSETETTLVDDRGCRLGLKFASREIRTQFSLVARPMPEVVSAPVDLPKDFSIPNWKQDDQRQRNTCHAHGATATAEATYFVATHRVQQFSRRFSAILNVLRDGGHGDHGASIDSAAMNLLEVGSCPESELPYWQDSERWDEHIPQACRDHAEHFKCRSVFRCSSYEQLDRGVTAGWGFPTFGVEWGSHWANARDEFITDNVLGGGIGGHALGCTGWKTRGAERWYRIDNSHFNWGFQAGMFSHGSPALWDWICKHSQYGCYLVSDMAVDGVEPIPKRSWDWVNEANFASGGVQL